MTATDEDMEFTASSGNPFADLGLPDPESRQNKARLALVVAAYRHQHGLNQTAMADILGIDQPRVSDITRGKLSAFSLERLMELVSRLGMDVTISLSSASGSGCGSVTVALPDLEGWDCDEEEPEVAAASGWDDSEEDPGDYYEVPAAVAVANGYAEEAVFAGAGVYHDRTTAPGPTHSRERMVADAARPRDRSRFD